MLAFLKSLVLVVFYISLIMNDRSRSRHLVSMDFPCSAHCIHRHLEPECSRVERMRMITENSQASTDANTASRPLRSGKDAGLLVIVGRWQAAQRSCEYDAGYLQGHQTPRWSGGYHPGLGELNAGLHPSPSAARYVYSLRHTRPYSEALGCVPSSFPPRASEVYLELAHGY